MVPSPSPATAILPLALRFTAHTMAGAGIWKKVTYDFARLMDGATQVSCSGFGQVMIEHM